MHEAITTTTRRLRAGYLTVSLLGVLFGACLLWHTRASAETKPGITVSPVQLPINLIKGEANKTGTVIVRNDYTQPVSFDVSFRGLKLVGNNLVPSDAPEGALAATMAVTPREFTLEPGKAIEIHVTVSDAASLSPGGHYAALLIRQVAEVSNQLSLTPAVSVALFVTKEDGAQRRISVSSVSTEGHIFRLPTSLTATFSNEGNVPAVPRAAVSIYDPVGKMVMNGVINTESVAIYPGGRLRLQTNLTTVGSSWLPGWYREEVLYRYDGTDSQQRFVAHKLVIPLQSVAIAAALIVVAVGFVRLGLGYFYRYRARRARFAVRQAAQKRPQRSMDIIASTGHRTARKPRRSDEKVDNS